MRTVVCLIISCIKTCKKTVFKSYIEKITLKASNRRKCLNSHEEEIILSFVMKTTFWATQRRRSFIFACLDSMGWLSFQLGLGRYQRNDSTQCRFCHRNQNYYGKKTFFHFSTVHNMVELDQSSFQYFFQLIVIIVFCKLLFCFTSDSF